ncbi:MAG: hypothetical protein ABIF77_15725 [bacterium]
MKEQLQSRHVGQAVFIALLVLATAVSAQTAVDVTYTWTPPNSGSPVDHYVVEVSIDGSAFYQVDTVTSNTYTFTAPVDQAHQIRVAGVDAEDRQGPYSDPSDTYTPSVGPPGQPGKPTPIF